MRRCRAFTLLELLVVIGIILLLVSILMPVFAKVNEQAKAVTCQSHQRQLWQGVMAFALDNDNRVVGNQIDTNNSVPSHQDFLRGKYGPPVYPALGWQQAPQAGTLWRYMNHNLDSYLCPQRQESPAHGSTGTFDLSSNGHFDYAIILVLTGAKLEHLPGSCNVTDVSGNVSIIPCPYIVEEGPKGINNSNMEGGHSNTDVLAHHHFGGCYYVATDGSCQFFNEPPGINCWQYACRTPHGKIATFQNGSPTWGWWDGQ